MHHSQLWAADHTKKQLLGDQLDYKFCKLMTCLIFYDVYLVVWCH